MSTATQVQPLISGATRLLGIVGDPVDQVRSPGTFNPLIAAAGLDAVLVPLHAPADAFDAVIGGVMRLGNLDGLVITMPFKERILPHLAAVSDRVRNVGAANAARRRTDGTWYGEMLDGVGLVGAVRGIGVDPRGLRVGLVGAGGAGSAIAFELAACGVASLTIRDVDGRRAAALAERVARTSPVAATAGDFALADIDLLVNASPVGMRPGDGTPVALDGLTATLSVVDIVTKPTTPLLDAAAARGCRHAGGAAMVAAQAAAMLTFFGLAPTA